MRRISAAQRPAEVVRCLKLMVAEHGVPNGFHPGEIAAYHTTLSAMEIGLASWEAVMLMRKEGYEITYTERRFVISALPTTEVSRG